MDSSGGLSLLSHFAQEHKDAGRVPESSEATWVVRGLGVGLGPGLLPAMQQAPSQKKERGSPEPQH